MTSLFAFMHHVAAFTLVAALAIEFAMSRGELTIDKARTFLRADQILGISAGILLAVGLARVFYFEKGSSYYFHSVPFVAKLLAVGAIVQFVLVLFSDAPNARVVAFGRNLGLYLRQIAGFVIFATEDVPFPFSAWPSEQ